MRSLVFGFFIILSTISFAQDPEISPGNGRVYGVVRDTQTSTPVEFATVVIIRESDSSIVSGGITDVEGKFTVESLPMERLLAKVSFVGYDEFVTEPFAPSAIGHEINLGVIRITPTATVLGDITVVGEKDDYVSNIDKKIYDVSKNLSNVGGSATDILGNIPSVTVDIDGNVSLRGSDNVTIFIDGKPSSLTGDTQTILQSLPSSVIERIEIVTNPSAKYEASGVAGIINIVTKKDRMSGTNGNVQLGAGTRDKYNASVGINKRTGKYNVFANYAYRRNDRFIRGYSNNIFLDSAYNTINSGRDLDQFHSGKAGVDLFLNDLNTLSISGAVMYRTEYEPQRISYEFFNRNDIVDSAFSRLNVNREANPTYEATIDYRKQFQNSKRELIITGNYSITDRGSFETYSNSAIHSFLPYQLNDNDAVFENSVIQADYVHPVEKKGTWESGFRITTRKNDTDQKIQLLDDSNEEYLPALTGGNHFIYDEKIFGAYLLYTGRLSEKFEFNAGLRGEQTVIDGNAVTTSEQFNREYFSLFPSGSLKYMFTPTQELQLTYSRRINRPNNWRLNPIINYADSLNLRSGNPYLNPEYINSVDLSYSRFWDKFTLTNSLFYRYTTDNISFYTTVDEETKAQFTRPINFSSSQNMGLEVVARYQLGKGSNLMWSFNAFRNVINADNVESNLQRDAISWNTRLTGNIKVAKATFVQVTGFYMAPNYFPQGSFQGWNALDLGIRQEVLKGKGSLTLSVSDVFNTRKWKNTRELEGLYAVSQHQRESRIGTLTFSYRFGSLLENGNQRNKRNGSQNGQQEGGGDMDF